MKAFKVLFIIATILWGVSPYFFLYVKDTLSVIKFGILFLAILIEELYYLIKEKLEVKE